MAVAVNGFLGTVSTLHFFCQFTRAGMCEKVNAINKTLQPTPNSNTETHCRDLETQQKHTRARTHKDAVPSNNDGKSRFAAFFFFFFSIFSRLKHLARAVAQIFVAE